jgi:hypothetical protein
MPERPTFVGPTNVQLLDPSSITNNPRTTGDSAEKSEVGNAHSLGIEGGREEKDLRREGGKKHDHVSIR